MTEFRTPTPQDDRKKGSKILKLPRFAIVLHLQWKKLVVIIKSLKVRKTKKILLYEMKFLIPNYSCLQNLWLGGYRPQSPVLSVLSPQLNLLNHPGTKFLVTPLPDVITALRTSMMWFHPVWYIHTSISKNFANFILRCVQLKAGGCPEPPVRV